MSAAKCADSVAYAAAVPNFAAHGASKMRVNALSLRGSSGLRDFLRKAAPFQ
jgi:hypothetical protein